ncbi:nucleotidyl transferase AbiEii/AbiGii toxin family protein [Photobacterium damselae]|uniref:nucleotidyl transferase AbiEii/AbiGii toxin family protein n=1 Tax=Photobacterium damselae TaxID=38293 RepID=UPI0014325212|nr:nucleotidyl transferase AbiEii/AbiGii toxin family protein [Photobacterium damselae]MBE8127708.1 nucleotidyl transferase AbiEii/AbiGii toxin family protein [Photobacterium damselae subsp. piscicida]NVO62402.1 nucleotidyl transferase AbiEii/AbiGii toxin family protein [Photobacterium damselae subsp. damselae]
MSKYLELSASEKREALLAAEGQHESKLPAYIIEKDYWVTQTLNILYKKIAPTFSEKCDKPFLFKGGTSLSKGYRLINRMSEDIDLSFSLNLLGCQPIDLEKFTSRKARQAEALVIDTKAEELIKKHLINQLTEHLQALDPEVKIEIESDAPLNIAIYYPKALNEDEYGSAAQQRVLLETGGRSDNHPDKFVEINHMLGEAIPELLDDGFDVLTLSPERTILEKMFAIHTNHVKGSLADKHARHLYDIIAIDSNYPDWCTNRALFEVVVNFCDIYYKWHADSCSTAMKGPLMLTPQNQDMTDKYKKDWESMADMFPRAELPYSFDDLIDNVKLIEVKANSSFYVSAS